MRLVSLLAFLLCLSSVSSAQDDPAFRFGGGPWEPIRLLAASDDGTAFATAGDALYASTDSGLTWSLRSAQLTIRGFAPARGDTLWAGAPGGVYRSVDAGATWELQYSGDAGEVVVDGTEVVAFVGSALWRLRNGSWSAVPLPPAGPLPSVLSGHLAARNGRLAVGRVTDGPLYRFSTVQRSGDDGATWSSVSCGGLVNAVALAADGTTWCTATETASFQSGQPGGVYRASPAAASEAVTTTDAHGAQVLADGTVLYAVGQSVVLDGAIVASTRAPAVERIVPAAAGLLLGTTGVTYSGFDPPSFSYSGSGAYLHREGLGLQVGIVPSAVYALASDGSDGLLVGGLSGAVHRLAGGGWVGTGANLALVRFLLTVPDVIALGAPTTEPQALFAGILPGAAGPGADATGLEGFSEVAAIVDFGDRRVAAVPGAATYAPADEIGLRVRDEFGAYQLLVVGGDLRALYRASEDIGYAGAWGPAADPSLAATHRIYRTADGGATWTPDDAGVTATEVFAFVALNGLTLAGTDDGVIARDGDGVWSADGLAGLGVRSLAVYDGAILAGTSDGLFRRSGGTWTRYGTGLDGRTVYAIHAGGTTALPWLAVGTDAGVYATRTLATVGTPAVPEAPATALRAFPNPTRDRLTLGAGSPHAAADVYDAFGRRVARLRLDADGTGAMDTRGLAAGVYLVRVATADAVRTVRFTVLR